MNNRLLVNPGTPQAWEITLKPGVNRIGRTEENDFTINHQSVSTHHCEITVTDQAVFLKDLDSTNGTFVERVPVTEIQLYPGQHVQFGAVGMTFQSDIAPVLPEAINQPAAGARIISANPGPAAPPPPPASLRISRPEATTAPSTSTPAAVPMQPLSPTPMRGTGIKAATVEFEPPEQIKLGRGIIGAVAGGLLGMLVWYFLIKLTSSSFSLVAWGVGVAVGFGGRFLAKRGSMTLGLICAFCALVAIIFGEYLGIRALVEKEGRKFASLAYFGRMEYARTAIKAADSPEELRKIIAEDTEKPADQVTAEEIKTFQEKELPELRNFVEGKPSKAEFAQELGVAFASEFNYKEYFFKEDVKAGAFMVLFVALGVWTAWKIGSGEDE